MEKCDYGCGKEYRYIFKNGKKCCSENFRKCSKIKEEHSKKMLGFKHSEESKKKMGSWKGKKLSLNHRKKMSESHKGNFLSDKTKEKLRQSSLGRKHSDESKNKISLTHKNKIVSNLTRNKISKSSRKYNVNESYFNNISSSKIAYWLGFIQGDGCICGNSLIINLSKKDESHLLKFKKHIKSEHNINSFDGFNPYLNKTGVVPKMIKLQINSMKICNKLKEIGISERKSLTTKPINISYKYEKDYWRGLIDADGSLNFTNNPYKRFQLELTGTNYICEGFKTFCKKYIKSNTNVFKMKNKSQYTLSYNNAKIMANILYKNSSVYLDRKYEIAKQFFNN